MRSCIHLLQLFLMQTMCVKGESPTRHVAEGRVDKVDVVVVTNKKKKKGVTEIIRH